MEYKTGFCLNTTKLWDFVVGITYALKAGAPFSQSFTLYYEKLHFLTVKKITIWYKSLLLLNRVFSERFATNFNPQFI